MALNLIIRGLPSSVASWDASRRREGSPCVAGVVQGRASGVSGSPTSLRWP
jgi:hypothetical protein